MYSLTTNPNLITKETMTTKVLARQGKKSRHYQDKSKLNIIGSFGTVRDMDLTIVILSC